MTTTPELSLPEWTVLTVLAQQPAHGFAVAQLTAPHAELGRVWTIPRPIIYRAIGRLADAASSPPKAPNPARAPSAPSTPPPRPASTPLIPGSTPPSTTFATSAPTSCSNSPSCTAPTPTPPPSWPPARHPGAHRGRHHRHHPPPPGTFDATLHAWRRTSATAALDFLDTITTSELQPAAASSGPVRAS